MNQQLLIQCTAEELAQLVAVYVKDYLHNSPNQEYFTAQESADFLRMPSARAFLRLGLPCSKPNGKAKVWERKVLVEHFNKTAVMSLNEAKRKVETLHA